MFLIIPRLAFLNSMFVAGWMLPGRFLVVAAHDDLMVLQILPGCYLVPLQKRPLYLLILPPPDTPVMKVVPPFPHGSRKRSSVGAAVTPPAY